MTEFLQPREIIRVRETDPAVAAGLREELGVPLEVATILAGRGLCSYEECERFFRPKPAHFHDPFLFDGMERAVARILAAAESDELVVVHGDYDVDGVTATTLLVRVLRHLGVRCDYYLPDRLTEGYGMSSTGVDAISSNGATLIITVDCGITACREVARAAAAGIDVIVTDHHEPGKSLPDALAVLNPKAPGCEYPDKNLAGVGVALKLCQAIVRARGLDDSVWLEHLDIVALGTAADIVPLIGENRVIVKLGFEQVSHTRNEGLRALVDTQRLTGKPISTREVVFQLAPCINAAGRLGDSSRGVRLLLTEDVAQADLFARELVQANIERRALDAYVREQAETWVFDNCSLERDYVIVAGGTDWHVGVIGIAASRLVERFYRPTILFSIGEDGTAKGSGRSVRGLHLLEALHDCSSLLESYGGHAAAAGVTIRSENIPAFRQQFGEAVAARIDKAQLVPEVRADVEVSLGALTQKFYRIVEQMAPFGPGNMRPVLLCRGLSNRYQPRTVGKGHLKMAVAGDGFVMDAIAFNFGDRVAEVRSARHFSLAFSLDENEYQGRVSLQMKVKGVEV